MHRTIAILLLSVVLAAATAEVAAAGSTVETTGEGEVSLAPDQAMLSLGVTKDAPTAKQALDDNARVMTDVLAALAQAGFSPPDVATRAVSLTPLMDYKTRAPSSRGSSAIARTTPCR
jgi:uncharacterized protein YggE